MKSRRISSKIARGQNLQPELYLRGVRCDIERLLAQTVEGHAARFKLFASTSSTRSKLQTSSPWRKPLLRRRPSYNHVIHTVWRLLGLRRENAARSERSDQCYSGRIGAIRPLIRRLIETSCKTRLLRLPRRGKFRVLEFLLDRAARFGRNLQEFNANANARQAVADLASSDDFIQGTCKPEPDF